MVTIEFLKQNHLVLFSTLWFKSKSRKYLQYYSISSLLIPFIIKTKNLNLLDETLDLVFKENERLLQEFAIRELIKKIKKPKTTIPSNFLINGFYNTAFIVELQQSVTLIYQNGGMKNYLKLRHIYFSFGFNNTYIGNFSISSLYHFLLPKRLHKQYLDREYTKTLSRRNLVREYERIIKLF